jgi:hypothetical protein
MPAVPGWGCPCMASDQPPLVGYDGWPLLGDLPLAPGERRRVGFVFPLSPDEATSTLRKARVFFLWEGHFIGRAVIVA